MSNIKIGLAFIIALLLPHADQMRYGEAICVSGVYLLIALMVFRWDE